ncbi:MAG: insulinase family protein [Alphaproteobacteria bacterium]|nr:insulinase family protein [Alphaproteobacteria bacterium]
MKRVLLVLTLAAVAVFFQPKAGHAGESGRGVFNPETATLANGMRIVVIRNHRVPVLTHMVWYAVGAADEGPGETGVAHVLEHLMFKGTKTRAPGEFSRILARNGGQENAFTSSDYTAYYQTVAADRLEMVMEMEADRMTNLVLTEKGVQTEKAVVMEERRSRTDNNPGALLSEQVDAALYLNHPYRRPVIGWAHEIEALNLKAVMAFYKKWYAPGNAILVVAGDITLEKLKPLAEKYYGAIPVQPPVTRIRPTEPPQHASRRLVLKDKRVRQQAWGRAYLAPSHMSGDKQHAYALEVLANILGHGSTSRLYQALVVEDKLAVGAGSYYSGDKRGPGNFKLYVSPRPGVSMETLEAKIESLLAGLLKHGVTPDEVLRATKRMRAQAVYARDSLSTGARVLGAALAAGLSIDYVETWPDHIGAVTADDVNAAARAVLKDNHSVTSLLLQKKTG